MHRLLRRLLKKSGLTVDTLPDERGWHQFLKRLNETFVSNDEDRYLLERSLEISSLEMQELLEASQESFQRRLTALVNAIPDLIFYVDEEGLLLDLLSKGHEELLHRPKEKIVGRYLKEFLPSQYAKRFLEAIRQAIETDDLKVIEYAMRIQNEKRDFEARIMPTNLREKGKKTVIVIVRDVSERKRSMEYLGVIKKIFDEATEGIFIVSLDGTYVEANTAFCRMLGLKKGCHTHLKPENVRRFFGKKRWREIIESLQEKGSFKGEVTIFRQDGKRLLAWLIVDTVNNEEGKSTHRVAMLTDLSDIQRSREQLRHTATHDPLTGLPNRMLLFEKLEEALVRAKRNRHKGALLFIDLDNFKEVNDTAGHKAGDTVLRECVERIASSIRGGDVLGRLGGDEFLLILEDVENVDVPMHVGEKIIEKINRPFRIKGELYELGASIGVALFPDDSDTLEALVQHADMAMYHAKQEGKNRIRYYSKRVDEDIKRHYQIESILKEALRHNRFYLLYQPQIDLSTGKLTGVEALLRIQKTRLGELSPTEFIPIAEESHLMMKIGRWVFEECCRQITRWQTLDVDPFKVAINISRRQLMDEEFVDFALKTTKRYNIDPKWIELEITETTFMHSQKVSLRTIEELRSRGFHFSIDDFGTGYSSLANLKHFIVNKLKIDQSFIRDISDDDSDRAIVQASIVLAHALGLEVIAEGVENDQQRKMLKEMGCDKFQGFLFCPPCSADQITALLLK